MNPSRARERRRAALLHLSFFPTAIGLALVLSTLHFPGGMLPLGVLVAWLAALGAWSSRPGSSLFSHAHRRMARRELGQRLPLIGLLTAATALLLHERPFSAALLSLAWPLTLWGEATLLQARRALVGELPAGQSSLPDDLDPELDCGPG